jgi:hypothetical protein
MNEGSGTTFADSVSGHNGTLSSSGLWSGDFVNFTLATQNGIVADHADFGISSTVTIFGWVKGPAADSLILLAQWDYGGTAQRAWIIGTEVGSPSNKLRIALSDDGTLDSGHIKDYKSSIVLLDNTWRSIAFRFNAGALDLFVDGVKDTSVVKTIDDAITTIINSTAGIAFNDLLVSGTPSGIAGANASMKKFRFYNNAKTDAQIAAMHALGP